MPTLRSLSLILAAVLAGGLPCSVLDAQESAAADDAARQERLEFMKQALDDFTLTRPEEPDRPLPRTDEPALRWSNPIRNFFSDGATFLWLKGRRPVAAATMSIRGKGKVWREFVSLTDQPLHCEWEGSVVWSPTSGGLVDQQLTDAPVPADTPARRLVQMRRLARRFTFLLRGHREEFRGELRLLTQPVYRYADDKAGIVDGAVFAFAQTTDPEALLVLEVHRSGDQADPVWRLTLARMTSLPLAVQLDGQEIWSVEAHPSNSRAPDDPYVEVQLGVYEPPADGSRATEP